MTYNGIYVRAALLADMRGLELPGAALAEVIKLRVTYGRRVSEFEQVKAQVAAEEAPEEVKRRVVAEKAAEEAEGFTGGRLSEATLVALCEAVAGRGTVVSRLSKEPVDTGDWLERVWTELGDV